MCKKLFPQYEGYMMSSCQRLTQALFMLLTLMGNLGTNMRFFVCLFFFEAGIIVLAVLELTL